MANFMLFDVEINWLVSAFRLIFAFLDAVVYSFIAFLFRAIFNLANFELIGFYEILEKRVYVILGIFMLFKVTISIITYLVNPDKLNDKEQGVGKLVTRILTVLIMLIALPTVFGLMTEFQNKVLPVIPRVIMGTNSTLKSENVSGIVTEMSTTMLDGFAHAKEGCGETKISDPWQMLTHINDPCNDTDQKHIYKYDYLPIVSTVVGGLMCYVLFSLSISVAIRAFKLIILRMLAPVPVVSYIDPKSSKDGMFSKWTKTFINVWAELFIHIGLIYFIVYIINFLLSGQAWLGFFDGLSGPWAVIDGIVLLAFLIIGLLMFAKSAPKFIMDALGIKSTGSFTRMLGMGATAIGGIGAARSSFRARQDYDAEHSGNTKLSTFKNAGASLLNGLRSGMDGGNAILTSDKPTLKTGYDAQTKYNSKNLSDIHSGIGLFDRMSAVTTGLLSGSTPLDDLDRKIASAKAKSSTAKQVKDYIIAEGKKKAADRQVTLDNFFGTGHHLTLSLDDLNESVAYANSTDGDGHITLVDSTGQRHVVATSSSLAGKLQGDTEEATGRIYSKLVEDGVITDGGGLVPLRQTLADSLGVDVEALRNYQFIDSQGQTRTIDLYHDPSQIKKIEKSNQTEAFSIENSAQYSEAKKIYGKK